MKPGSIRFNVLVQPRARRTQIVGRHDGGIKVQVNAPPVDGAANEAVIDLLAAALGVPRRSVRIVQGASSRRKVIEMDGPSCRQRFEALLAGADHDASRPPVDKGEPRR